MSYEPTTWKDGDLVTSAKLNKLENGVAAASGPSILIANVDMETNTLDKTWQEIYDADICYVLAEGDSPSVFKSVFPVGAVTIYDNMYTVQVQSRPFVASSPNNYPTAKGDA